MATDGAPQTVIKPSSAAVQSADGQSTIERGTCYATYVYDVGYSIDLNLVERRGAQGTERETIKHKRKAPRYFEYQPAPLRINEPVDPIALGQFRTGAVADCVLYDFGAISVTYEIDIAGPLDRLASLSDQLYESKALQHDSRRRVDVFTQTYAEFISKSNISPLVEDYVIFQIAKMKSPIRPASLLETQSQQLAQILRSEQQTLSDQEVRDALSHHISFSTDDVTIIDWQAALVIDDEAEDVRTVLEFANVELLEMRYLDDQLDRVLDQSYRTLSQQSWRHFFSFRHSTRELRRLARLQMESAVLFEEVNNALKLLGDQYLARVYRLASQRLHIGEWDASILRKLHTVESIYSKMSDHQSTRRMELLEWIIIALIAISTILALLPGLH
jgi:hypothetical protein